jgi:methionyl-tRNA formyltransferase
MTAGLDCGPVFSERTVTIGSDENAGELHDRLAALGAELLLADLEKILSEEIVALEQDEALATYAGKIRNQDAELDWALAADELQRHIRAYNPVPGAFFFTTPAGEGVSGDPARIKVWQARVVPGIDAAPGTFVQYDSEGIVVACGRDGLQLDQLQLPGKRRVRAHEFVTQIDLRG